LCLEICRIVPESVRFLLANNKKEGALAIIKQAAKMNDVVISKELYHAFKTGTVRYILQTYNKVENFLISLWRRYVSGGDTSLAAIPLCRRCASGGYTSLVTICLWWQYIPGDDTSLVTIHHRRRHCWRYVSGGDTSRTTTSL